MTESIPVSQLCDALYDRCKEVTNEASDGLRRPFTQADILGLCNSDALEHVKDADSLLPVILELVSNKLFLSLKANSGASSWSLRRRDIAKQLKQLQADELMVYEVIEDAYETGIWIKHIRKRTGISDNNGMGKLVARLQRLSLIKSVKNVKAPAQKTYMLYHLAPSDEVTGGSFYDAGDLDESLVEELSNLIVFHVRQQSWVEGKKKRIKRELSPILIRDEGEQTTGGAADARGRKRRKRETTSTAGSNDIEEIAQPHKRRSHNHGHDPETDANIGQMPYPAGHEYPTAATIHKWVTTGGIIRTIKSDSLTIDEVQNILNVLVWDEKLEEVNHGYRTVRGVTFKQPGEEEDEAEDEKRKRGNGLTEAPCGRCPVVHLCGTGGPINAASCVYFDQWLRQGVAAA